MMDKMRNEALRYLGYRKEEVDDVIQNLISECFEELGQLAEPRHVVKRVPLEIVGDGHLKINQEDIYSYHLCRNLKGCHEAILFCATLGIQVDRQIQRYSVTDITRAVVLQACAAAYLESYCDEIQQGMQEITRPRFSPGYGDFDLMYQEHLLEWLDAHKQIGLTKTEGFMLIPTKSVTAIIGIQRSTL